LEPALFAICKVARRVTIIQDATCLIIMPIDDDKKLEKSFYLLNLIFTRMTLSDEAFQRLHGNHRNVSEQNGIKLYTLSRRM